MRSFRIGLLWLAACTSAGSDEPPALEQPREVERGSVPVAPSAGTRGPSGDGLLVPIATEPVGSADPVLWTPPTCGELARAIDVSGEAPFGPLHFTRIGLAYWGGFTFGTQLLLEGTAAGMPAVLMLRVASDLVEGQLRPQCPPGSYRPGNDWRDLYPTLSTAPRVFDLTKVELRVERHEGSAFPAQGEAVRLVGRIVVADPGWSLDLPFDIDTVCSSRRDG